MFPYERQGRKFGGGGGGEEGQKEVEKGVAVFTSFRTPLRNNLALVCAFACFRKVLKQPQVIEYKLDTLLLYSRSLVSSILQLQVFRCFQEGQDERIGLGMMWGKGEGGLGYSNSQSLTHFLLHEAPRSINCFSPVNGMLVCAKVTFITLIY